MDFRRWTIGSLLDWAAANFGENEYIVSNRGRWTYSQFKQTVDQFAAGLIKLGVQPGEKIITWLPNWPEFLITQFAVSKIGAVFVPVNTRYKDSEMLYCIKTAEASTIILPGQFLKRNYAQELLEFLPEAGTARAGVFASERFPHLKRVIQVGEPRVKDFLGFEEVIEFGAGHDETALAAAASQVRYDDLVHILFTSGTTSFSKGVMLSHGQVIHNNYLIGERHRFTDQDALLVVLPLFGAFTGLNGVYSIMTHGGKLLLQDVFEAGETLDIMEAERCTTIYAGDPIFNDMFAHPSFPRRRLDSWKRGLALPLSRANAEKIIFELGVSDWNSGYGMTETSVMITMTEPTDPVEKRISSIGRPMPLIEVCVKDPETGEMLPPGQMGEMCVRGYTVTAGYYKMPEETAKAFDDDGWFHTGDLGEYDEHGYFYFRGRIKEMVKPGGFNVSSLEIEQYLQNHPAVMDAAVVGIPDDRLGEAILAVVRTYPGQQASEDELKAFCRQGLANFKVPSRVWFVDEFPRTSTGKPQKNILREQFLSQQQ